MIKKIISIILVLIWMGVIFSFSSANGESSGGTSRAVIVKITETLTDIKDGTEKMEQIVDKFQLFVRKSAHFFEYFVLACLVTNMLYSLGVNKYTIIVAALICIAYAASDELHQHFIADRSGNLIDVMWDSSAALIGSWLFYKIKNRRIKNEGKSK